MIKIYPIFIHNSLNNNLVLALLLYLYLISILAGFIKDRFRSGFCRIYKVYNLLTVFIQYRVPVFIYAGSRNRLSGHLFIGNSIAAIFVVNNTCYRLSVNNCAFNRFFRSRNLCSNISWLFIALHVYRRQGRIWIKRISFCFRIFCSCIGCNGFRNRLISDNNRFAFSICLLHFLCNLYNGLTDDLVFFLTLFFPIGFAFAVSLFFAPVFGIRF